MAKRRSRTAATYTIVKPADIEKKLTEKGFPGEQIAQIWKEEDIPDVYVVNGTLVVDLNFMNNRTLLAVKKDKVAIVADKETDLLRWIRNVLKKRRKFTQSPGSFVYRAIKKQLDIIREKVAEVHKKTTSVEKTLAARLHSSEPEDVLSIYDALVLLHDVRRELSYFWKVVMKLRRSPLLKPEEIEDIKEDVHEVLSFVTFTIKSTNSLLDLHDRALSMELNLLIKRLTAISIILAVITIITGIYGMNFRVIPLAEHPYGFWIINGLMVALFFLMWWWFKKIGWI